MAEFPALGSVWRNKESGILGTVTGLESPPMDTLAYTVMLDIQATETKFGEVIVAIHPTLSFSLSLTDFLKEWMPGRIGKDVSKWEHIKVGLQEP